MDFLIFIINFLFSLFYILLALRAILPWIPKSKNLPILGLVYNLTDPFLSFIRLALPPQRIGIDVSPFIMIILLWLLEKLLVSFLLLI